jgi:ElaB/YqjD/DUF883 family membrane-anchored ribosome-binding protein
LTFSQRPLVLCFFQPAKRTTVNSETGTNPFPTSSNMGTSSSLGASSTVGTTSSMDANDQGTVQRMAQKAREAVDKLEQTLGTSGERVMGMQQEYGDYAREQVRDNPLGALGVAFVAGIVFSKLFMR